jgi:hypothetical protein
VDSLIAESKSDQVKQALQQQTTALVKQFGMFGAPWMISWDASVDLPIDLTLELSQPLPKYQCFWGSDRLESLAYHLNVPYPGAVSISNTVKL